MGDKKTTSYAIDKVETLLAHSITLESEAEHRYQEIADSMDVHNNPDVAELFRTLSSYAAKHAEEMRMRSKDYDLPHIAPWDFLWEDEDSPESADFFQTHYMMTPYHVIQVAMQVEKGAFEFYSKIAKHSNTPEVVAMAREFADEELEHVEMLKGWVDRYPKPQANWSDDLDPPMMHE